MDHLDESQLEALFDERLPQAAREPLIAHARACEPCGARLSERAGSAVTLEPGQAGRPWLQGLARPALPQG